MVVIGLAAPVLVVRNNSSKAAITVTVEWYWEGAALVVVPTRSSRIQALLGLSSIVIHHKNNMQDVAIGLTNVVTIKQSMWQQLKDNNGKPARAFLVLEFF